MKFSPGLPNPTVKASGVARLSFEARGKRGVMTSTIRRDKVPTAAVSSFHFSLFANEHGAPAGVRSHI